MVGKRHVVLFTVVSGPSQDSTRIDAVDPATGARSTVVDSARYPMYAQSGYLMFLRDGGLVAARFDPDQVTIAGTPTRVTETVAHDSLGAPLVSISAGGHLVYVGAQSAPSQLVWVNRQGLESSAAGSSAMFEHPRISPDGRRVAVASSGTLWMIDRDREGMTRLTPETLLGASYATWTPDGRSLYFRTATGLVMTSVDGNGRSKAIAGTSSADFPNAVSADGAMLLMTRQTTQGSGGVYALPLPPAGEAAALVDTPAYDGGGQLSPDGRWLAYASAESGQFEVYLRPYPSLDQRWLVSSDGGSHPRWARDGSELYYREGTVMYAVTFDGRPDVGLARPQKLFDRRYRFGTAISFANYDVAPDGRFLMVKGDSTSGRVSVVLNWTAGLAARR